MMLKKIGLAVALAATSGASAAEMGIGARGSTLGFGVEAAYAFNPTWTARAQGNYIGVSRNATQDGTNYDAKIDFKSMGVLADYHPFDGSFRLTGGAYYSGNQVTGHGVCATSCTVGDNRIRTAALSPGNPANVDAKIDLSGFAPYVGFGWGNYASRSPFHFSVDIGVMASLSNRSSIAASGRADVFDSNGNQIGTNVDASTDPTVQGQIPKARSKLEDAGRYLQYYPVIGLGFGWSF